MTRREFVKRVFGMSDVWVKQDDGGALIVLNRGDVQMCMISENTVNQFDNFYRAWNDWGSYELFQLIVEYASTPLDERVDEVRYQLFAKEMFGDNCLNQRNSCGKYYFSDDRHEPPICDRNGPLRKNEFTEEEIEQMPEWCQALERVQVL